jgi:hypothetical protein
VHHQFLRRTAPQPGGILRPKQKVSSLQFTSKSVAFQPQNISRQDNVKVLLRGMVLEKIGANQGPPTLLHRGYLFLNLFWFIKNGLTMIRCKRVSFPALIKPLLSS